MFDFYEKRKIRSFVYSKPSVLIVLLLTVWLSLSVYERFTVERAMLEKRNLKEGELIEFQERAALLESQVQHLKDERGIEEELRKRFDVAKEGEQVVIILEDKNEVRLDILDIPSQQAEREHKKSLLEILKFW